MMMMNIKFDMKMKKTMKEQLNSEDEQNELDDLQAV
jgi:hypothetical protein